MTLYEKKMIGKRTTYVEHQPPPPPDNSMMELEQSQVVTLLSALTISMLMSVSTQLQGHSKAAREIRKVEEAVKGLCALNAMKLDAYTVGIGVAAWNAAIRTMQEGLMNEKIS